MTPGFIFRYILSHHSNEIKIDNPSHLSSWNRYDSICEVYFTFSTQFLLLLVCCIEYMLNSFTISYAALAFTILTYAAWWQWTEAASKMLSQRTLGMYCSASHSCFWCEKWPCNSFIAQQLWNTLPPLWNRLWRGINQGYCSSNCIQKLLSKHNSFPCSACKHSWLGLHLLLPLLLLGIEQLYYSHYYSVL